MGVKYTVGMCPSPILDDSMRYDNRKDSISESQNDTNVEVEVFMCPSGNECHEGLLVTIKMCPTGVECGCGYNVDNLIWNDNGNCGVTFSWNNPDRCILRQVNLEMKSWWDQNFSIKYTHERIGDDLSILIYPDGDIRNAEGCRDCGIGGEVEDHEAGSESVYEKQYLVPGQIYLVAGYFDDMSCGGREVKVELGYVLYQTTGFTSGQIISQVQSSPPKYSVQFYERDGGGITLKTENLFSSDYSQYENGDPVMLVKMGTDFPASDHIYTSLYPSSSNVNQITSDYDDKMFIAPFNKIEGS